MDTASTSRKLPPAEKLVEINGPYWNLFQAMLNLADTCEVYEWATTRACGSATNGWIKFHDSSLIDASQPAYKMTRRQYNNAHTVLSIIIMRACIRAGTTNHTILYCNSTSEPAGL